MKRVGVRIDLWLECRDDGELTGFEVIRENHLTDKSKDLGFVEDLIGAGLERLISEGFRIPKGGYVGMRLIVSEPVDPNDERIEPRREPEAPPDRGDDYIRSTCLRPGDQVMDGLTVNKVDSNMFSGQVLVECSDRAGTVSTVKLYYTDRVPTWATVEREKREQRGHLAGSSEGAK